MEIDQSEGQVEGKRRRFRKIEENRERQKNGRIEGGWKDDGGQEKDGRRIEGGCRKEEKRGGKKQILKQ